MVKKFKKKIYEKTTDDHYIVVVNPWFGRNGFTPSTVAKDLNSLSFWLRKATRKPDKPGVVKIIYRRSKRDEVIVRVDSEVEIESLLGKHEWNKIMNEDALRVTGEGFQVTPDSSASLIFMYNYSANGDPAEHEWTEYFPAQSPISDKLAIKNDYPDPSWVAVPPTNNYLVTLALPLPEWRLVKAKKEAAQAAALEIRAMPEFPSIESILASEKSSTSESLEEDAYFSKWEESSVREDTPIGEQGLSKLDKCGLDPYEREEAALAFLRNPSPVPSETSRGKTRPPGDENTPCESAPEVQKTYVKEEEDCINAGSIYTPSDGLRKALALYITTVELNTAERPGKTTLKHGQVDESNGSKWEPSKRIKQEED